MAEVVVKLESIFSRERESVVSGFAHARFFNKARHFLTGRTDHFSAHAEGSKSEISAPNVEKTEGGNLRVFTYSELVRATNYFIDKEVSGIYSLETIYKGWVDESTYAPTKPGVGLAMYVRTKRLTGTSKLHLKPEEFNHPNLVKLLGYCLNNQKWCFVYKLIPNASLDKLLFGGPGTASLSWVARLKIAVGAAQGLTFLHKKGHPAYTQFKTACILVDTDFKARLRDFEVGSTFVDLGLYLYEMDAHYAAPEWFRYQESVKSEGITGRQLEDGVGVKSEIYSFGVVLLEILTGMKVFDWNRSDGKQKLVKWAIPLLPHEANLGMILDPQLQNNNQPLKGAYKLALLVLNCLQ